LFAEIAQVEKRKAIHVFGIFDVLLEDGEELVGAGIWQRFEKDGVNHAEDRGVGADAEREREDGDRGESGIFPQHAEGEAEILKRGFNERQAAEFAICFFELRSAAEANARGASGFFWRHATGDVFLRGEFEMRIELVLKFAVDRFGRRLCTEARDDGFEKGEHGWVSAPFVDVEHAADYAGDAAPVLRLGLELFAARLCDRVKAGLAIVFGSAPLGGNPTFVK